MKLDFVLNLHNLNINPTLLLSKDSNIKWSVTWLSNLLSGLKNKCQTLRDISPPTRHRLRAHTCISVTSPTCLASQRSCGSPARPDGSSSPDTDSEPPRRLHTHTLFSSWNTQTCSLWLICLIFNIQNFYNIQRLCMSAMRMRSTLARSFGKTEDCFHRKQQLSEIDDS